MNYGTKHTATVTEQTKNTNPLTLLLRTGKDKTLQDLANYTFETVVMNDGTKLEDLTFQQLSDVVWTLQTKN